MTTRKDDPARPAAGGDTSSSRPHATLDLKATVVNPPAASKDDKTAAKDEKPATASAEPIKASAALPGASPRGEAGAVKPELGKRPVVTPPPPKKAGGYGGFFSHLAAGIAGGIVALLTADMLASHLGLSGPAERDGAAAALQQRIVALETTAKQKRGTSDLTPRLAAAEAKLEGLEKVGGSVDRLAKRQDELAGNIKAIDAKTAQRPDDAAVQARVSKLEEQLNDMSTAAVKDPQSGRLPQLAALTGKVVDLESTINTQLDALRKSVTQDVDSRLATTNETSEAAKSGTQRIDRELAGLKTESGQLTARFDALKADADRAGANLKTTEDAFKKLKTEIDARLATFARPEDVAGAVTPLAGKLAGLQKDVQSVVKSETDRKATAERIVLSLELASLKRAIDRGTGFANELADASKLSGNSVDLTPLQRFASTGVPTPAVLQKDFKAAAFKMIDADEAPADGSVINRLLAGAKSVVRVRKVSQIAGDASVEAVVARMEAALKEDRLGDVLQEAKTLPPRVQNAGRDFLAKVEARNAVDGALSTVEAQLKSSLVAPAGAPAKSQE
jgi:hypothetical protein